MEIKVCTTSEWNENEWWSYCKNFNLAFQSDSDIEKFKHSYLTTIDGHSYHALLINDNLDIVGSCTVIPLLYKKNKENIKIGQAVGVFILEEYRSDPLMLRKMYHKLKDLLIRNGVVAVLAVPNSTSYSYWRNIVKWQDVGDLTYWALPIRVGNIINKWKFLNFISLTLSYLSLKIGNFLSLLMNNSQKKYKYEICKDEIFYKYRYSSAYKTIIIGKYHFIYILYNEKGIKTAYLLESYENGNTTFKSIHKGVSYINKNNNVDIILYIGPLKLFQTVLLKVPKKIHPKRLPLTCDILLNDNKEYYSDMLEFSNWNFGLLNYDVR